MPKSFWARVEMKKWVGRVEVDNKGVIIFTAPIAYRWKGKKWIDFVRYASRTKQLVDFQIFYQDKEIEP